MRSTTYPGPAKDITDHKSEQHFLHHAMLLHSGVVAVRRPSNPYFWGYYPRGARGRWQTQRNMYQRREICTFHPLEVLLREADLAAF